jgi:hypothetical protein
MKRVIYIALLATLVLAQANNSKYINVAGAESMANEALTAAVKLVNTLAVVGIVMMISVVGYYLVTRRGVADIFHSWLFWVPFFFIIAGGVLWAISQVSPAVNEVYTRIVGKGCPFLYCP